MKRPNPTSAIACLALASAALAAPAAAQCRPAEDSNEASLLAFYSAPILFGTLSAPEPPAPWSVRVAAELVPVPTPDRGLENTGSCFVAKSERTRLAPVFGRPRLTLGLPWGFALEGSYVPPVTVDRAQPHLGSVALSQARRIARSPYGGPIVLAVRAHATLGRVRGPITCSEEALQQDASNAPCYGRAPSRDTFRPNMAGVEATLGAWSAGERFGAFIGGGYTSLRPRFQVGFTDDNGIVDTTRVEVDLHRASAFGGFTLRAVPRLDLSLQAHVVPGDVVSWHLGAGWRLR